MNIRLVFMLSLFGLFMAIGTVFFIPSMVEPFLWLPIFIVCAFIIARQGRQKAFLNGLMTGIFNSVWITAAHIIFMEKYFEGHPAEKAMLMPEMSAALQMLLMGFFIGVISGVVIGLFSLVAKALTKKSAGSVAA